MGSQFWLTWRSRLEIDDPHTRGQNFVFQRDLIIMVHADLQMLALIIMEKILKKKMCEGKNLNFYIGPEGLFVNGDASEEEQMTGETPE